MEEARLAAEDQAEAVARTSYGKLLSILASRSGDIAASEDALAAAFLAALTQWPRDGIPDNPVAWLLTVAKRSAGHTRSRRRTAETAIDMVELLRDERHTAEASPFGDKRLELMFVCAHPAIDAEVQTPLMLQTVLGLDATRIASCFLMSSASIGQRLVRAKRKIRCAGIAFVLPELSDMPARVDGVLSAVYAAYGTAWEDVTGSDSKLVGLADEAIWLARLLTKLMPGESEVIGLLSLMLHCEARRVARRNADGAFVALHQQDPTLWSRPMIIEAETLLRTAAMKASPGRFQTEAAIQSLHAHQRMTGERFTEPLVRLYDILVQFAPTIGVLVARAVAYAENGNPTAAIQQLDHIKNMSDYQPWWAARARACWLAGKKDEAWRAAGTAAGLSSDASVRQFLLNGGFAYSSS
jgi:RNA polymerase sigma-70 factor, ECF subfamily